MKTSMPETSLNAVYQSIPPLRFFCNSVKRVTVSYQIASVALVRRSSPPPGLSLWSSPPPTRCWSSQSAPAWPSSYDWGVLFCSEHIQLLFRCTKSHSVSFTFTRSLNLGFSLDVGSSMILSAFSSVRKSNVETIIMKHELDNMSLLTPFYSH